VYFPRDTLEGRAVMDGTTRGFKKKKKSFTNAHRTITTSCPWGKRGVDALRAGPGEGAAR